MADEASSENELHSMFHILSKMNVPAPVPDDLQNAAKNTGFTTMIEHYATTRLQRDATAVVSNFAGDLGGLPLGNRDSFCGCCRGGVGAAVQYGHQISRLQKRSE